MATARLASRIAFCLALLVAGYPVEAAGPDVATVTTLRPIELTGQLEGESPEAVLRWNEEAAPTIWHVQRAHVEIKRVSMPVLESPVGDISYQPEFTNETIEIRNGTISILPVAGAIIRLHGHGRIEMNADPAKSLPLDYHSARSGFHYRAPSETRPFYYNAEGVDEAFVLNDTQGLRVSFAGDGEVFVIGAIVRTSDAHGTTETALGESSQRDATVPHARRDEYAFMTIQAVGLTFRAEHPAGLEATQAQFAVNGEVRFHALDGFTEAGRTRFPNLIGGGGLIGAIRIQSPEETAEGLRYKFEGKFEGVALGDQFVKTNNLEGAAAIGIIAALATLVTAHARATLGSFAGALYTRIARSSVLENPARQRALDHLQQFPGTHFRDLQRAMGWGWGTLHYHLAVLRKANLIVIERAGKHALAYPRAMVIGGPELRLTLRGQASRVYDALDQDGATQSELVEQLGLSRQLVAHHLARLEEDHLLEVVDGRPKVYKRLVREHERIARAGLQEVTS